MVTHFFDVISIINGYSLQLTMYYKWLPYEVFYMVKQPSILGIKIILCIINGYTLQRTKYYNLLHSPRTNYYEWLRTPPY